MIYYLGTEFLIKPDNIEYCTKEFIVEYCLSKEVLCIDTETMRKFDKNTLDESIYKPGLDPYVTKICMYQIGDADNQFIIDARAVDCSFLNPILENDKILKIFHNAKFDCKHIYHNYKPNIVNIWDTMLCEKILYNGLKIKYSLEALAFRYLNIASTKDVDLFSDEDEEEEDEENEYDILAQLDRREKKKKVYIDKSIRTQFINIENRSFTVEEIIYGANDIIYPYEIYFKQREGRLVNGALYKPTVGFALENKFAINLAKIELRGLKVDTKAWTKMYQENKKIFQEKIERLDNWVIENHPKFAAQIDLFTSKNTCSIMWSSSTEVVKFARYLKICPKEKSKSTGRIEYTVGAKAMFKLLTNDNKENFLKNKELEFNGADDTQAFILNYLLSKKYQQLTTTFGLEWLRYIHPITKKVHTNYIQLMNTGRLSSTSPNCQQIPNGKAWRQMFISDCGKLIATDFNSQEAYVAAVVTNNTTMLDFFNNPDPIYKSDFHCFVGTKMQRSMKKDDSIVINKEDHPKERQAAKAVGFKSNYGASGFTISEDLGITPEEGDAFLQSYFDGFPGLEQNFTATKKLALRRGWVELDPYTKKRYFFPDFEKMNQLYEKAWSYYPDDYRRLSKEERQAVKDKLKLESPELSILWKDYMSLKGKLERSALNYRIQGFAAAQCKIAILLVEKEYSNDKEGIVAAVHDEIVGDYLEENCDKVEKLTLKNFTKSGTYFTNKVKFGGTSAVGDYWIH